MALQYDCQEWNFSDINISQYVMETLGPRCLNRNVAILTEVIYSIIFGLGVTGNVLTCIIIAKDKSMHSATNFYLFSLAVSDLLSLLLGLPFELYQAGTAQLPYTMPAFVCKGRAFVSEMTTYASVLTITAFSIERWFAICFPLKVQAFSRLSRAIRIICAIWIVAMLSAMPVCYYFQVNELSLPTDWYGEGAAITGNQSLIISGTNYCYMDPLEFDIEKTLIATSFWIFFLVPLICLVILYSHIGITIYRAEKKRQRDKESHKHDARQERSRKIIIRMLIAVVVAFFVCWLPFHIQRLSSIYVSNDVADPVLHHLLTIIFYVSGYFYYSNSALNPLLYNLLNRKFRRAFLEILCRCCKWRKTTVDKNFMEESHMRTMSINCRLLTARTSRSPSPVFQTQRRLISTASIAAPTTPTEPSFPLA